MSHSRNKYVNERSKSFRKPRILLDLSHTYFAHHRTGIQRVVRNLWKELPALCRDESYDFAAIVLQDQKFVYVDGLESEQAPVTGKTFDVLKLAPSWYVILAKAICFCIPLATLRRWLLPKPGHLGILRHVTRFRTAKKTENEPRSDIHDVVFHEHDIIIMPDGYWIMMHIWDAVADAKKQGARVAVVVYDLICITHPQFFGPNASECFTEYLKALNSFADMVVAISDTIKHQLKHKLRELADIQRQTQIPTCESFRLGVTLDSPHGTVREDTKKLFDLDDKPYLMVATFEPRKNHSFVLDSFDSAWDAQADRRLLLVGAAGWMCDNLLERIRNHPRFGTHLFMINDASDAEVQYCYENCKAAIFPSFVEGFGLPIIEALRNGKTMFASDTPIHREVGQDKCRYLDLSNAASLNEAINAWEGAACPTQNVDQNSLTITWNDSVKQLLRHVCELKITVDSIKRVA